MRFAYFLHAMETEISFGDVKHFLSVIFIFFIVACKRNAISRFFLSRANASAMRVRKVDPLVRDLCFTLARKAHAREFKKISPVL